jgi:multidrug efflux pump subunit AcrB
VELHSVFLSVLLYWQWGGEHYASTQSTRFLFATYPFAIILMITILIMLFGDYKKPLVIICSIPFLLVGVVTAFLVTDKTFGFVALIGTLGLVGMMIKNGVVLMDEIKLQLASGMEPVKAITGAATNRFRPVMMASITTILGVIPLYSDDLFGPMAVAIMGGLLIGTLVTLLLIPTIYALFFRIRNKNEKVSDEK